MVRSEFSKSENPQKLKTIDLFELYHIIYDLKWSITNLKLIYFYFLKKIKELTIYFYPHIFIQIENLTKRK